MKKILLVLSIVGCMAINSCDIIKASAEPELSTILVDVPKGFEFESFRLDKNGKVMFSFKDSDGRITEAVTKKTFSIKTSPVEKFEDVGWGVSSK